MQLSSVATMVVMKQSPKPPSVLLQYPVEVACDEVPGSASVSETYRPKSRPRPGPHILRSRPTRSIWCQSQARWEGRRQRRVRPIHTLLCDRVELGELKGREKKFAHSRSSWSRAQGTSCLSRPTGPGSKPAACTSLIQSRSGRSRCTPSSKPSCRLPPRQPAPRHRIRQTHLRTPYWRPHNLPSQSKPHQSEPSFRDLGDRSWCCIHLFGMAASVLTKAQRLLESDPHFRPSSIGLQHRCHRKRRQWAGSDTRSRPCGRRPTARP